MFNNINGYIYIYILYYVNYEDGSSLHTSVAR
jgi:hypothetical protein